MYSHVPGGLVRPLERQGGTYLRANIKIIMKTLEAPEVHRLKMSYGEYLRFGDSPSRSEWVDGEVVVYTPPRDEHQRIVGFLYSLLNMFARLSNLGVVQLSPFEVKLWEGGPSREPDIFFVKSERLEGLSSERFDGAPDLAVEPIARAVPYLGVSQVGVSGLPVRA